MQVGGRSITTHGPELVTAGGSRRCTQPDKPTSQTSCEVIGLEEEKVTSVDRAG